MNRTLIAGAVFWVLCSTAFAQESKTYTVIVDPSNPIVSVSKRDLSSYFLKKTQTWADGRKILPVDQKPSATIRIAFTRAVHGKSVGAIKAYWNQRIFSGRAVPPPERRTDAEVIDFVLSHPGAIGYVSSRANLKNAKAITITD